MSERNDRVGVVADHPAVARRVAVLRTDGAYKLLATEPINAGMPLFTIDGELTDVPTRYSVQVGSRQHLDLPAWYGLDEIMDRFYWRFTNHSCDPSAVIRGRVMIAVKPLERWQEITFHYNTTEYELAEPFGCQCGSRNCAGRIRGFRFVPRAERQRLRPWLADHLRTMLDEDPAEPTIIGDLSL